MRWPENVSPYDRAYLLDQPLTIIGDVNFPYLVVSRDQELATCNDVNALARHHQLVLDLHPVHLAERQ